ncbi:MAG TPA: hypothetical protein VMV50_00775 [Candidatus Paceibacterota bacterium]|nr:hypothetical protein [Candidatus Paceibacterota bacterium]
MFAQVGDAIDPLIDLAVMGGGGRYLRVMRLPIPRQDGEHDAAAAQETPRGIAGLVLGGVEGDESLSIFLYRFFPPAQDTAVMTALAYMHLFAHNERFPGRFSASKRPMRLDMTLP